jgi:DNA-binding MarR family transcriptional regulator
LNVIQRATGFTRVVILSRAAQLGLGFCRRRPWTAEEIEVLTESAGKATPRAIARRLNRTYSSVKAKLRGLELRGCVTDGYSQQDLQSLLGVGAKSTRCWIASGWLRLLNGRISEASVVKFLRQHSDQYQLSRVDEAWFKGLVFAAFNNAHQSRTSASHIRAADYVNVSSERPQEQPSL